jgi:hypothetical protein
MTSPRHNTMVLSAAHINFVSNTSGESRAASVPFTDANAHRILCFGLGWDMQRLNLHIYAFTLHTEVLFHYPYARAALADVYPESLIYTPAF